MARAITETLLSLDQWAEIMGFNPYEFNQIGTGIQLARDAQCQTVFYQYSWQKQFLSREEIALAVAQSENAIESVLGFAIAPKWYTAEEREYPQGLAVSSGETRNWLDARGRWKSVPLKSGYVTALGTRTWTLVEADVAITRSDEDGDGIEESWTATVTASDLTSSNIRVFFSAANRDNLDASYLIRPVSVSYDAPTLTVKGKIYQLVNPTLAEWIKPSALDFGASPSIFVDTIDIYQESASSDYGTAYWDAIDGLNCTTPSAAISSYSFDGNRRVRPQTTGVWTNGRAPNRLEVNYRAGYPLENGRVNRIMAMMVARLSTSYMPALSCGCDRPDQILSFWRSSPADTETGKRPMTMEEINENIFGTNRGAIFAWQQCQLLLQSLGVGV